MQEIIDTWYDYFVQNATAEDTIPWELEERLTDEEIHRISASIATFQLGEYSEGKGLLLSARAFESIYNLHNLTELTTLFIKEELHHAGMLKRFMEHYQIPHKESQWTDSLFRRLRKNVPFELSITVLITAEMIALTYYKALSKATHSKVLQAICEKNLHDELAHVTYESQLLKKLYSDRSSLARNAHFLRHTVLFGITLPVVWITHRGVFLQAGYRFSSFCRSCWETFHSCI